MGYVQIVYWKRVNCYKRNKHRIDSTNHRTARVPGGYSTLNWVRMCGPKFRPPPYNKTREDANLLLISKPFVSWRALFKTNQCFLQCKLGCISTFWWPIDKPKDKFIGNYAFCKNTTYLNQFSNKKGAMAKPESPKKHPIWAAHPRTHLSTKYPPPPRGQSIKTNKTCNKDNITYKFKTQ